ncbi:MAG: glycosyltransferase [Acidobacteria bacterium]|nr:glycosyltransferase [Acidobacteriota bacterium]
MQESLSVLIAIPVLNEERALNSNVRRLIAYLKEEPRLSHFQFEIVIADNGSADATPAIGRDLEQAGLIRYQRLEKKGVGLAFQAAWDAADSDIVGFMDLDLSTDLRHLPDALEPISKKEVELVCGSRLLPDSQVRRRPLFREVTSRVLNLLIRTLLGSRITDAMCGFKFLTARSYRQLRQAYAASDGWFFSAELSLSAEKLGIPWREIPVSWTDNSDSRSSRMFLSLLLQYLKRILEIRRMRRARTERCNHRRTRSEAQ